ncbi:hypothetical protein ACFJ93_003995 [Vibrio parahaemolyticus]|nr:hypothetical protein [Vibrio parahaemolyticus]HBC3520383.1 hypothetical protein [Vibrio parahaemolyticus]
MAFTFKLDSPIHELQASTTLLVQSAPEQNLVDQLVELAAKEYISSLEKGKNGEFGLLIHGSDGEELIHLAYRSDITYLTQFDKTKTHIIKYASEKNIPTKELALPNGEVLVMCKNNADSDAWCQLLMNFSVQKVAQIERLDLHPTLQRQGFFTKLVNQLLCIADTGYVLVTNIINDEWFEYLKDVADEIVENRFHCSALFNPK